MARQAGIKGVRAHFADAVAALGRPLPDDPPAEEKRGGHKPGAWPGAPVQRLPPDCPVVPLGKDGDTTFFVDTLGQLRTVNVHKWGKKVLIDLFAETPNFLQWAWPRFGAPKGEAEPRINGLEVDEACACLIKAAAARGLFSPADRVRGRGAWTTRDGGFVWHSGEALWKIERSRLVSAAPGELDGVFYPRRPAVLMPWQEPIDTDDSPAHDLLAAFRCWQWERPTLDPVLLLGWLGAAIAGGALGWRPTLFVTGDRGQGKSTLQAIIKEVLGDALHATADTTPAGIYQRVRQDTLAVAVDELEADADNRRAKGVIALARLAASGATMFRGGAEHEGVEFQARNCFFFSSINPPPLGPQDRSRMALLNLRKIDQGGRPPTIPGAIDTFGRVMLRQVMDAWGRWPAELATWREAMRRAGLDGRAQDTYGTLLAMASLLVGHEAIEEAGLPVSDEARLGELVAAATQAERSEQVDNWRACLDHLLGSPIEAWRGGGKPTIGAVIELYEEGHVPGDGIDTNPLEIARKGLATAGLGLFPPGFKAPGATLAIPASSPILNRVFAGTPWSGGVWTHALKQGPREIVVAAGAVAKINKVSARCVLVDLAAYDAEG